MKLRIISIIFIFAILNKEINCGAACYGACITLCLGMGAIAFGKKYGIELDVTGCQTMCMAACARAAVPNLPLCYEKHTKIIANENEEIKEKKISEIKEGDLVLTEETGKKIFTKVLSNIKTEGNFSFVQISCLNSENIIYNIKVTSEHIMIILDNEIKKVVHAKKLKIGNLLPSKNGNCRIIEKKEFFDNVKYTLLTEKGTLFSSNILTTNLCEDQIKDNTELSQALENWKFTLNNLNKN